MKATWAMALGCVLTFGAFRATAGDPPPLIPPAATEAGSPESPREEAPATRLDAIRVAMVIKVLNPDATQGSIRKAAEGMGGYATMITNTSIVLKLPPDRLTQAIEEFGALGIVIEKSISRTDVTRDVANLEGSLRSKMDILAKLRTFFDNTDLSSTLQIEQSMNQLVSEIESIKGALRLLRDQSGWAVVDISFQFRERDKVLYVSSPFDWLNTANLDRFLEEF